MATLGMASAAAQTSPSQMPAMRADCGPPPECAPAKECKRADSGAARTAPPCIGANCPPAPARNDARQNELNKLSSQEQYRACLLDQRRLSVECKVRMTEYDLCMSGNGAPDAKTDGGMNQRGRDARAPAVSGRGNGSTSDGRAPADSARDDAGSAREPSSRARQREVP
jgi:hypothetical protein